jgi:putative colanic acid biosynthesis UDP-glucose lipid carrier transferase
MGHMSVAGPRPHMLKHTEHYSKLVKHYLIRHYVKPGITGWAQVNGYRGETDELWKMEKRVKFDMDYIENWTLSLDIKIVFLTLFGKNALKNAG